MFAIIIGLIVIALVVTLLLKGYYPQAILFMGGVVLLTCTAIFGWGDLLNAKQTTNFIGFDIFKVFSTGFSSRIAGLGPLAVSPATWSTWEPQPPCSRFLKSL